VDVERLHEFGDVSPSALPFPRTGDRKYIHWRKAVLLPEPPDARMSRLPCVGVRIARVACVQPSRHISPYDTDPRQNGDPFKGPLTGSPSSDAGNARWWIFTPNQDHAGATGPPRDAECFVR